MYFEPIGAFALLPLAPSIFAHQSFALVVHLQPQEHHLELEAVRHPQWHLDRQVAWESDFCLHLER